MSTLRHADTGYSGECHRLLDASEIAREVWNRQRGEICRSRLVGKETGDELLRLQAKYAIAYTVLQKHVQNCLQCKLVSRIA